MKKENWKKYKRSTKEIKQFYEGICKTRTGFQPRTTMCKNKQGEIVERRKMYWKCGQHTLRNYLIPKLI